MLTGEVITDPHKPFLIEECRILLYLSFETKKSCGWVGWVLGLRKNLVKPWA